MKNTLFITFLILATTLSAQKSNRLDTLHYDQIQNPAKFGKLSKQGKAKKYISKLGAELKIGDTIFLREAFANYGKDAGTYSTILEGDPLDGGRIVMMAFVGVDAMPTHLGEKRGEPTIIEMIRWSKQTRKRPPTVNVVVRSVYGGTGAASTFCITDLELAFEYKEIYHRTLPMTKDDLVLELRKAKDELELGLINQDDYDGIKFEIVRKITEIQAKS